MKSFREHILQSGVIAREALKCLSELPNIESRTLFVIDEDERLIGTITDGDIRRGLLGGLEISDVVDKFMNKSFQYLHEDQNNIKKLKEIKNLGVELLPLLDHDRKVLKILDLSLTLSVLPVSALLMAGGRGERLKPFTDTVPKPMLVVGDKPIIEHNIDRLTRFGITEIFISVKYLSNVIKDYFGDGSSRGIKITYIEETEALGTIGCLSLINDISNKDLLVMNSDLLTNIDFEAFYTYFIDSAASMSIASIPYSVNVPYAVLETEDHKVLSFTEKPVYTYYSNAGLYFLKSALKNGIPYNSFYNATDLIEDLIKNKQTVSHYPIHGYWLDIGKHQDFMKAQDDIKYIKF